MSRLSRVASSAALLLCGLETAKAQAGLVFPLSFGPNPVGFRSVDLLDRSREITGDSVDERGEIVHHPRPRPINVSIWYPAIVGPANAPMLYGEYLRRYTPPLRTLATAERREVGDSGLLRWGSLTVRMPGVTLRARRDSLASAIARERSRPTHAVLDALARPGSFPIVIYAAGAEGPSFENDLLAEYLASRGYVVLGVPCWAEGQFTTSASSLEAVARDIEFILAYARQMPGEARAPVGLIGWSWGGFASVVVASRNRSIDAVAGFDASVRYFYSNPALRARIDTSGPFVTPTMLIVQGGTPARTIAQIGGDTLSVFFDSLRYADAFQVTMRNIRHQNFASLYNRLAGPQPSFFVSDPAKAMSGYATAVAYVATFFDSRLKKSAEATKTLAQSAADAHFPDTNVTVQRKAALRPLPTASGFLAMLGRDNLTTAPEFLAKVLANDPAYTIEPEGLINVLGVLLDDDRYREALGLYRVFTTLHPRDVRGWNGSGDVYVELADTVHAIASFQQTLAIDSTNRWARQRLTAIRRP